MALSLNPSDAEEVPLDQRERVIVMDAYTEMTDYGGRAPAPCPVLTIDVKTKSGYRRLRSYSAGGPDHVRANDAGNGFEPVGDSRGMPAQCNAVAFLQSLVAAGFPAAELAGGDITTLIGLELVLIEVDQPQRFTPKPKPILGLDGVAKKDALGNVLFHPPEKPKRYWLVAEVIGAEAHLPGLVPPRPVHAPPEALRTPPPLPKSPQEAAALQQRQAGPRVAPDLDESGPLFPTQGPQAGQGVAATGPLTEDDIPF